MQAGVRRGSHPPRPVLLPNQSSSQRCEWGVLPCRSRISPVQTGHAPCQSTARLLPSTPPRLCCNKQDLRTGSGDWQCSVWRQQCPMRENALLLFAQGAAADGLAPQFGHDEGMVGECCGWMGFVKQMTRDGGGLLVCLLASLVQQAGLQSPGGPTLGWAAPTTGSSRARAPPRARAWCTGGWGSPVGAAADPRPLSAAGTP